MCGRRAEPSHPVHLAALGPDHVPHAAAVHPPRRSPAAARAATRSEAGGERHDRSLAPVASVRHGAEAPTHRATGPASSGPQALPQGTAPLSDRSPSHCRVPWARRRPPSMRKGHRKCEPTAERGGKKSALAPGVKDVPMEMRFTLWPGVFPRSHPFEEVVHCPHPRVLAGWTGLIREHQSVEPSTSLAKPVKGCPA